MITEIAGALGSALGAGAGQKISDKFFGGNPASDAQDMMDRLYPGTSPYERLSAGGGGAAAAGAQEEVSKRQARTAISVAQIGANAQKEVAQIQAGVGTRGQNLQYGFEKSPITDHQISKMKSEIKKLDSEKLRTDGQASVWEALGNIADDADVSLDVLRTYAGKYGLGRLINDILQDKFLENLNKLNSKDTTSIGRPLESAEEHNKKFMSEWGWLF